MCMCVGVGSSVLVVRWDVCGVGRCGGGCGMFVMVGVV